MTVIQSYFAGYIQYVIVSAINSRRSSRKTAVVPVVTVLAGAVVAIAVSAVRVVSVYISVVRVVLCGAGRGRVWI